MDSLWKDIGFAARSLRKNPAFSLTAILTLALGIGASTALFSVVNAVLLRPLPYADAGRLVLVWGDMRNRNVTDFPFPPGDYPDLKAQGTLFQDFAAVTTFRQPLSGDGVEPEQVSAAAATTNIFSLLGARVALGRDFVSEDGTPQAPPPPAATAADPQARPPQVLPAIVILSNEFWQRRYGGDRSVIGKNIDFGGQRAQVVGVLAPDFELLFPASTSIERQPDVWTAMRVDFAGGSRTNVFLRVIGRLKPGVTVQQAQLQMDRLATDLRERFPIKKAAGLYIRLEPMHDDLVADVRPAILALMGAVIFVLLIACANVANLLLVRASWRERELAVRAALGGSQWRLVRQMLAESLLLASAGALLGLGLARLGISLLVALAPDSLPRVGVVRIDLLVLAFTAIACVLAAGLFGIVPAIRASRPDLMDVLRASGRTTGRRASILLRNGVVMAEVALSFVLLIGCGLMLRSFVALHQANPGYDPNNLLTFVYTDPRDRGPEERAAFMRTVRERIRALPGVQAVTAASPFPLDGQVGNARWGKEDALADASKFQQADIHIVLPGYFEAMKTKLIAGRTFTNDDNRLEPRVIIVDQKLAAKAFPGENPVGKRLLARVRTPEPEWFQIVGVVGHQRNTSLAEDSREAIFVTDGYFGHGAAGRWAVRTSGDVKTLAPAVRAELRRMDAALPVAELQPMSVFVDQAMATTRFAFVLIAVFAVIAAVLAAVGLYGVLSTVVRLRTSEIGMRMAFGAPSGRIFQLVIGQGLRLSGAGIVVGLVVALLLTRVMTSMLVGVAPTDPVTFAAIAVLFVVIAALASFLPARRAAAVSPIRALREE
jgi:predicted permease